MTKADLVKTFAAEEGITNVEGAKRLEAVFDFVHGQISYDKAFIWPGFGRFKVVDRKARNGRNPHTGETIRIAAKKIVQFSPAKALAEAVK